MPGWSCCRESASAKRRSIASQLELLSDYFLEILVKNDNIKKCGQENSVDGEEINDQLDSEKSIRHRE